MASLDPKDFNKIIYEWNQTEAPFPDNKTIHQLFEKQVSKTPDNIAVVFGDVQLTYQELNQKANQLAHYLRKTYKIKGDDLIALCLDKSEKMLIAILAVLKSGAAYVPIDPCFPDKRIEYIYKDTLSKLIITNKIYENRFINTELFTIDDQENKSLLNKYKNSNPINGAASENLAYVIFTSGTTGKPKGVMIEHKSLVNEITFQISHFNFKNSRSLLTADYVFDMSIEHIFITLLTGSQLHIVLKESLLDIPWMESYIFKRGINFLDTTPTYISNFSKEILSKIDVVILGGEKYSKSNEFTGPAVILNSYGPTETTIISTISKIEPDSSIHIGRPIANTTVYILDKNLKPVPIGVIGELHIGGVGLARGYLNKPELTAEKFIPNPFVPNEKIYKTGDQVRYLPDGNIEFIGRTDSQVKIRGFRIELGEIEAV
ncbi:MAG: amino acid adenylation domain-containing protein, partial [Gammaproteobacteria bacterium]